MNKLTIAALSLFGMLICSAMGRAETVGPIDFFGYQGLDVAKVRAALPLKEDDPLTDQTNAKIAAAVVQTIGRSPTSIEQVCCDSKGRTLIYIGLPGGTYKPLEFNPRPKGTDQLPAEIVKLVDQEEQASAAAVAKGGDAPQEDDSQGFALIKDPATRAFQLQERAWAVDHESEAEKVLRSSSDAKQRRAASTLLGYTRQSPEQIAALVYGSRDADRIVRNNAIRALGVLVRANPQLGAQIDPEAILAMLGSGSWSDHNKAVALLDSMTVARDPKLLAKIKDEALDPLIEMATWSEPGHAMSARLVLGRVGGIPEEKLDLMAWNGPVDPIIAAARGR